MGFRTAFEKPSWKLTQISRSFLECCPRGLTTPAAAPSLDDPTMRPKKSRFAAMGFDASSGPELAGFEFVVGPESSSGPPPARYLAWRRSALWRRMYFWYSWSSAWRTAYLAGVVVDMLSWEAVSNATKVSSGLSYVS